MKNKVSVIVPIYNQEMYLDQMINSLLKQSYPNLEIILIDDGSVDSSLEICNKYKTLDDRIIVIHKENGGVSSARNIGIENATGDFIYFCDADDILSPYIIQTLYSLINEYDCDISICNYSSRSSNYFDEKKVHNVKEFKKNELIYQILNNSEISGFLWNKLFKKKYISNLRFNENLYICEDEVFCLEYISRIKAGIYTKNCLYYYRINSQSATQQGFSEKTISHLASKEIVYNYLIEQAVDQQFIIKYYYVVIYFCCCIYWDILFSQLKNKKDYIFRLKEGFFRLYNQDYGYNKEWSLIKKMKFLVTKILLKL